MLAALAMSLGLGATAGCSDEDDGPGAGGKGSGAGMGGGPADGGKGASNAGAGVVGRDGGGGPAATCECGDDVNAAQVPLACACEARLCTTFDQDLPKYRSGQNFGLPFYVLFGTCASGYRTLSYEEALGEQGGRRTYDAEGRMVYDLDGYSGVVPDACGFDEKFSLGSVTIGEDPSKSCSYCLVSGDDNYGAGGAGATDAEAGGAPFYPESLTPRCDPSLFE